MEEFHLEGKYSEYLLKTDEHATKSQKQSEKRIGEDYKPMYQQYVNTNISFLKQYNSFYEVRLKSMKPKLVIAAKTKWGNDIPIIEEICLLEPKRDCVIIGTIYKDLSLFKSILNDKASSAFNPQLIGTQFLPKSSLYGPLSQEGDPIVMEDSTTRVLLKQFSDPVVTGVVLATRGHMDENGDFLVLSICYANDSVSYPSIELPISNPKDPYMLCVSGLSIGQSLTLRTHLLFEYISSQVGFVEDVKLASRIAHVVLLGNSVNLIREPFQRIRQDTTELSQTMQCVENLDIVLSDILPTVPVTIVPGATDVTSMLLPQQPLHPSLFPRCLPYSSLECATNPYIASFNGNVFCMTSGQNVQDIARQITPNLSSIDIMQWTLRWGSLFPTDPNTCPGIPYDKVDPFIIDEVPDVYVVGNQHELQVERLVISDKSVVLITLPSFLLSGTVVMINLRTLSVTSLNIDTSEMEEGIMIMEETKQEEEIMIDEELVNEDE